MKLFLREHIPLFTIVVIQLIAVILIFWLDGYKHPSVALYALFVGLFIFLCYLVYRFMSHQAFYERLSASFSNLDESNQMYGNAPLAASLGELLKSQYTHYIHRLNEYEEKRDTHATFMNQWVHQMKTPLSVIELTVQQEEDERFVSIREEADKISKGLEMVLYAARLETFEHDFQVEPVSLENIVSQAIRENKRLFIKNHVYPEVSIESDLTVESDEKWLIFILNQLISNAVKYSSGSNEKVSITAFISNGEACLEVRDKGVGIPKSDVKRVFKPFYTGENGRIYRESTGMGLYLVKEVCDRLGHQITMESEVGKGTTVRLTFSAII
ncbi:sensor histidine kinase [Pueribacillus theae]|uniref:histidine kinase n=1 Tax=Pueribacillus theae TaxID=2171751 RepID=A0A2U1JRU1_9BACI|nr:sensor histidine kinase [Pueribacillus theae]PWA07917.1 sensor histidine kinase [Pueribacillus theae]